MKMDGIPSIGGLLDASFPRTRESRFGLRRISLDTRFRGYDGARRLFAYISSPHMYSKEDTKEENINPPNFVSFVVNRSLQVSNQEGSHWTSASLKNSNS